MNIIHWTPEEDNIVKQYYPTKSVRELQLLIPQRTRPAIKTRALRLNLIKRHVAVYDKSFFSTLNLQNCQVSGFISADGCICYLKNSPRLIINISVKDLDYLERICNLLEYTGNITYRTVVNSIKNYRNSELPSKTSVSHMCILNVWNCEQWRVDLEKNFSITPRKTLTLQPPKIDQLDLALSFISGNIDGDGSVVLYDREGGRIKQRLNISLLGTYDFLIWVKSWVDKIMPAFKSSEVKLERPGSKIYNYHITGAQAYIFSKMVLSLSILRMDRKWDKAREYIRIFESYDIGQDMEIKLSKLLNQDIVSFVTSRGGNFPDHFLKLI